MFLPRKAMVKPMKTRLLLVLLSLLCLFSVCACDNANKNPDAAVTDAITVPPPNVGGSGGLFDKIKLPDTVITEDRLDYVYRAVRLELPEDDVGFLPDQTLRWDGETFTAAAQMYDAYGFRADAAPRLYRFSPDDPTLTECADAAYLLPTDAGDVRERFWLSDGMLLYTTVERTDDGGFALYLHGLDAEQAQAPLFSVDLSYEFGVDFSAVMNGQGSFRLLDAVYSATAADGEALYAVLTTEGYAAFDAGGTVLWSSYQGKYPRALLETPVGMLYLYGDQQDMHFRPVDRTTGALGADVLLPDGFSVGGFDDAFFKGDGFDLYMKNDEALWGLSFVTNEDNTIVCEVERVVDFSVSALVSAEIVDVAIADRDNIAVLCRDSVTEAPDCALLLLSHIPRDEVLPRETIMVATLWGMDRRLARAVSAFNQRSETHRIVVKDYSVYKDGRNKTFFDLDIAAGKIPDIVLFGDTDYMRETYENIGLLRDLTPLFDADPAFSADLLGYTKTPYLREGGAQYVFPLEPSCGVLWGDGTVLDGPISTTEATALCGDGVPMHVRLLQGLFLRYTDPIAHTCAFDDPDCIAGLSLLLSREDVTDAAHPLFPNIAPEEGLYGWVTHKLLYGDTLVPVGIPVDGERLVVSDVNSKVYFGITVTSAHADTCISFLQDLIAAQSVRDTTYFTRSQVYAAVEPYEKIRLFVTPQGVKEIPAEYLSDTGYALMMELNPSYFDGIVGDGYQITDADAETLIAFLDDIDGIYPLPGESMLYDIFRSEYYQANGRRAEEIAGVMQSRASIYLAEVFG